MDTNAFGIERLNFRLPDFTRTLWVSDQAKATWQPRIQRIMVCWQEMIRRAVAEGLLPCTIQIIAPELLPIRTSEMAERDLEVVILGKVRVQRSYTALLVEAGENEPFQYRIAIGRPGQGQMLKQAWDDNDQGRVRTLLGYPACCRDFFEQVWIRESFLDTTWPMAGRTDARKEVSPHDYEIEGPAACNPLLRWLGVRAVPHLPCSFNCAATVDMAEQLLRLGREAGYGEEMSWLHAMLDWPVEWSALHGIAEIKTPIVKIATLTDATPRKYRVRRRGKLYPEEAAHGLTFPYIQPIQLRITESRSFKRGLAHEN